MESFSRCLPLVPCVTLVVLIISTCLPGIKPVKTTTNLDNSTYQKPTETNHNQTKNAEQILIRAGIVLTIDTATQYDFNILSPALDVAYARAKRDFDVIFEPHNYLYKVSSEVAAISPDPKLGRTEGCWMWNASGQASYAVNESMQVIIGPACTNDMRAVNELLTFFSVPSVTGGANLVDSTQQFPYLTRMGFNTYDMSNFVMLWFRMYGWRNIAVIYDYDSQETNVQFQSLMNQFTTQNLDAYDIRLNATEFDEFESVPEKLKEASRNGRVIVLLLHGKLLRYVLIEAYRLGMCNGDFVFLTVDLQFLDVLGDSNSDGNWKQRDGYDKEALKAYSSLFVLALRDFRSTKAFLNFNAQVQEVSQKKTGSKKTPITNYFSASFYDSVVMMAKSIRQWVDKGHTYTVSPATARNITELLWNSTFQGVSGSVYINPKGDRSDDMTLYRMTDIVNGEFSVVAEYSGKNGTYRETQKLPWRTRDGLPIHNEPKCGFLNDKCPDKVTPSLAAGIVVGLLVLTGTTIWLCVFVRARAAENLANRAWIIQWDDLQGETRRQGPGSRGSLGVIGSALKLSMSLGGSLYSNTSSNASTHNSSKKILPSTGKLLFCTWNGQLVMVRLCEKRHIEVNQKLLQEVRVVRRMVHENLLRFLGAVVDMEHTAVVGEYCSKGSLQDLLMADTMNLDWIFRSSLINDLVSGLLHLHGTALNFHGRLSSACCYVDGTFVLKVGDYGLPTFYRPASNRMSVDKTNEDYRAFFWTAPEFLGQGNAGTNGSQAGDVYAFAIILSEMILREEAYSMYTCDAKDIVDRVVKHDTFRPKVDSTDCPRELLILMELCWRTDPLTRPAFTKIRDSLKGLTKANMEKTNIVDLLLSRMEQYTVELEEKVEEKTHAFLEEKKKADALLNQILPPIVAEKLKRGEPVPPESYESATIFFSKIVGFAALTMTSTPFEIVDFLNDLYSVFDNTIPKFDVYKVETIHDSYMVASGLPLRNGLLHAKEQAGLAITLMELIRTFKIRHRPTETAQLRIGLNSGPVVASVIGLAVPRFCLFGDTVNTASRMESTGDGLKIQISPNTKNILDGFGLFNVVERGEIEVKGKGRIRTFWLIGYVPAEDQVVQLKL